MAPIAVDRSGKGKAFRKHYFIGIRWKTIVLLLFPATVFFSSNGIVSAEGEFKLNFRDKVFGMHFVDDKSGWIVGDTGLAVKTADGGKSWQKVLISHETFKDIFFVKDKGWIVGDGGLILHTDDGGKIWSKQTSNVTASFMRVFFIDEARGFAVGADGMILRTVNGGSSWDPVSVDWMGILPMELVERGVISINLYDIFFLNDASGWIVGDCGTILHTVDGGNGWSVLHIGSFPALFSVVFKDDMEGWAVGQNGFFLNTGDGGQSWRKVSVETEESFYKVRINGGYAAAVGDHGVIFASEDGGRTWFKVESGLRPPFPWLSDAWIFLSEATAKLFAVGKGVSLDIGISTK